MSTSIRLMCAGLLACAACTSKTPAPATTPAAAPTPAPEAAAPETVDDNVTRACTTLVRLADSCEFLAPLKDGNVEACVASNRSDYDATSGEEREMLDAVLTCIAGATSCDEAKNCLGEQAAQAPTPEQRACGEVGFGPVTLSAEDATKRNGLGARKYSEPVVSKEKPIEVCGVSGQLEWLTTATCDDGSVPFQSPQHAHRARSGSVGPGGKCGNIIDLYEVKCPERTYEVYMDAYMCGPGESF